MRRRRSSLEHGMKLDLRPMIALDSVNEQIPFAK
jgi:hypothetical protein